jgi:hypothetical protein
MLASAGWLLMQASFMYKSTEIAVLPFGLASGNVFLKARNCRFKAMYLR